MEGKHTSFIPACFYFYLINRQLRIFYVKAGSWSQTSCQLAFSSLPLIPFVLNSTLFVVSYYLHLLVRDVSNRWQRYEKVFVPLL